MAVGFEKMSAFLVEQIDDSLEMIQRDSGLVEDAALLERLQIKLIDVLWEAKMRYACINAGRGGINFAGLYNKLYESVYTVTKQALMASLCDYNPATSTAEWKLYQDLNGILEKARKDFVDELKR